MASQAASDSSVLGALFAPAGMRPRIDRYITPAALAILALITIVVWVYADMDATTARILQPEKLLRQARQHVNLTFWSTLFVVSIAIPTGILVTRPRYRRLAPPLLAAANAGQAVPAYGLLVLLFALLGQGARTAIIALVLYGILPELRNTMVGLDQVDRAVIEAGRGMGMSRRQVLMGIELPLAVPVILAGVRTALVINVGIAALAFLIGAGGLGETIGSGLKLQRNTAIFIGASLVAMLALAIDWIAAIAERKLQPRGL